MKILIFGSNGMLGQYVNKILSPHYNVVPITRTTYDIETNDPINLAKIIEQYSDNNTVIINCAGVIPQRNSADNYKKYITVNTLFPQYLSQISEKYDIKLIHITTDCVYNGQKGHYDEHTPHDETSLYGVTKSLGEPNNACIIRTSIIGEELYNKKSLLEWVISNNGRTINGYMNHYWNGVTCLTLAKIVKQIIDQNLYWKGIRHILSPNSVTKYQLCQYIKEIYQLDLNINAINAPTYCDKTLTSLYEPLFNISDIRTQIEEQRHFIRT